MENLNLLMTKIGFGYIETILYIKRFTMQNHFELLQNEEVLSGSIQSDADDTCPFSPSLSLLACVSILFEF